MRKRALVLTGDSLRHSYFINSVSSIFDIVGVFREAKSNYYVEARKDSGVVKHFENLRMAEQDLMGSVDEAESSIFANLNDSNCLNYALKLQPDVVLLFGTSILKANWLDSFDDKIINLHLGMSPFYREVLPYFSPLL